MGIVFALLMILVCRQSTTDAAFTDWGWRIHFLISAPLVLLSGYIRLKLEESPLARLIFFGWLSDHIGRRGIMTWGFALAVITYWPVFTWLGTFRDNPLMLTILVLYLVILVTMVYGPIAAFLVEIFPAWIR
jgi:MFS family permease